VEHCVTKVSSFLIELWEKKHLARPHSDQNRHFKKSVIATPWPCFAAYSVALN